MKRKTMIATLPASNVEDGKNYSGDKETHNVMHVIASTREGMQQVITCRFYSGRSRSASVHYCSIWFSGKNNRYGAGNGSAGGYGYHKDSAALGAAIRSAGIELNRSISGVGNGACEDALRAIARALGYRKTFVVTQ